jgi:hypothetical protein
MIGLAAIGLGYVAFTEFILGPTFPTVPSVVSVLQKFPAMTESPQLLGQLSHRRMLGHLSHGRILGQLSHGGMAEAIDAAAPVSPRTVPDANADAMPPEIMAKSTPTAAANVTEDLDFRIAQHAKSVAGWHTFLEAHPDGPHAHAAQAEIERPSPTPPPQPDAHGSGVYAQAATAGVEKAPLAEKVSSPGAAPRVSDGASSDAKAASEVVDPAAEGTKVVALTPDEICKRDGDRLERLRSSPERDQAARFANELGCEMLRPQLLALMESLDHPPSATAVAHPRPSVEVGSALSQERRPPVRPNGTHWTASRSLQPRQHANTRRIVDRRTQYQITMWLDCPVEIESSQQERLRCGTFLW